MEKILDASKLSAKKNAHKDFMHPNEGYWRGGVYLFFLRGV
jgi:hypothetical protein